MSASGELVALRVAQQAEGQLAVVAPTFKQQLLNLKLLLIM
jgi:hypothetical protein